MSDAPLHATAHGRRSLTLALLVAIYAINFLDRQILAMLQEPIKRDLALSDAQLGLLTGTAFALFYVLAGIPLGRLADRRSRTALITSCLVLWSGMTALCGAAQNFWQLALGRIGVGIGEGGCSPAAHSMISDLYGPRERPAALGIYTSGINIGILLGFASGGLLLQYVDWRIAFVAAGVPGLVLAVVFRLLVREPARGIVDAAPTAAGGAASIAEVARDLWQQPACRALAGGAALAGVAAYGCSLWSASMMILSHGATAAETGLYLALMMGVGGALGTLASGYAAMRYVHRGPTACLRVPAITSLVAAIGIVLAYTATDKMTAFAWLIVPSAIGTAYVSPSVAAAHALVPPAARGTTSALLYLVLNLAGLGMGPAVIGALSDALAGTAGVDSLRLAVLWVVPIASLGAALCYHAASRAPRGAALAAPPVSSAT